MTWTPSLGIGTQADVPRRLREGTRDTADAAYWTTQCAPKGHCRDVDTVFTSTCEQFAAARARGLTATTTMDLDFLGTVAARCAALREIGRAKPPARTAVRAFALSPAALDTLPAALSLIVFDEDSVRVATADRAGATLRRLDPALIGEADTRGRIAHDTVLVARSPSQYLDIELLARGDFDGDGWDDLLVYVLAGAPGGSFASQRVYVLTRGSVAERLRVARVAY